MIWYVLGGLIGIIFFKKKYNLSFWQAVSIGIVFALGLYFSFGAITEVIILLLALEEYTDTTLIGLLVNGLLAAGCFILIKRFINKENKRFDKSKRNSNKSNEDILSSQDRIYPRIGDIFETRIAGVTYEGRQNEIETLHIGQPTKLIREPENKYDTNAVKVIVKGNKSIGYINRDLAKQIAPIIDNNSLTGINGKISSIYHVESEPSILGVKIRFQLFDAKNDVENSFQHEADIFQHESYANCPVCGQNDKVAKVKAIYESKNGSPLFISKLAPPNFNNLIVPKPIKIPHIDLPNNPNLQPIPIKPEESYFWRGGIVLGFIIIFFSFLLFYINVETDLSLVIPLIILSLFIITAIFFFILDFIQKPQREKSFLEEKKRIESKNARVFENWKKSIESKKQRHKINVFEIVKKNKNNQKKYNFEKELIEKKLAVWKNLYYCYRDDTIFTPDKEKFTLVDRLNEFLSEIIRDETQNQDLA